MTALINSILGLATAAISYAGIQAGASPHINRLTSIRDQILAEENKGYDSNDTLIEDLLAQGQIETDAIEALLKAVQPSAPVVPVHV